MSTSLLPNPQTEFGLTDLTAAADALLSHASGPRSATDGRVRATPDGRTIRYYQSSGLVDRPLRYEGRRAIYGFRHLLQAVAIKLLQAEGLSLAQVQSALQGASTARLEAAVRDALATSSAEAGMAATATPPNREAPSDAQPARDPTGRVPGPDIPARNRRKRAGRERPMYPDSGDGVAAQRLWSRSPQPRGKNKGRAEGPKGTMPADERSPARDLRAFELAPGIHLTIDPERAELDPPAAARLAADLARFLDLPSIDDTPPSDEHDTDTGSPLA